MYIQSSSTSETDKFYRVSNFITPFNQKGIKERENKSSDPFFNGPLKHWRVVAM